MSGPVQSLAAAVEALARGHRETDVEIEIWLPLGRCDHERYASSVPGKFVTYYGEGRTGTANARNMTSSMDDLLSVIRRELPDWAWSVSNTGSDDKPSACVTEPSGLFREFTGAAATPELALCAAMLRALAGRAAS